MTSKAQAWGIDLLVGFTLFLLGFTLLYFYSINSSAESDDVLAALSYQGNIASQLLLSEGNPAGWNTSNVLVPGLLSGAQINQTKLDLFANLSVQNYQRSRGLLGLAYNYYLNFSIPMIVNGSIVPGIGQPVANASNIYLTERVVLYRSQPVTLRMILWD